MKSGLYVGRVRHRRLTPRSHTFDYSLFMLYLDLAELDDLFRERWFWSLEGSNLAVFRRSDYLGDPGVSLEQVVRDRVEAETGVRPLGPIRMLTHLRYFGFCFNPVTFYYCLDPDSERVEVILAEITNTPWRERHAYLLSSREVATLGSMHRYRFAKCFHVSPFMPMDIDYDWRFSEPGPRLNIHMRLDRAGKKLFDASLNLERRPLTGREMAKALIRYPFMTLKVIGGIYWQALLLHLKRTPVFDHPDGASPTTTGKPS